MIAENFAARLAQSNLITKTDFDAKLSSINRKITSNETRDLLRGLSDESIKPPTTTNNFLNPSLDYVGTKAKVKFSGDC